MILPAALALPVRLRFVAATIVVAAIATPGVALTARACQQSVCKCGWGENKVDIAEAMLKKMALEVYPQWSSRPSNRGTCPTAEQLGEYMATAHPKDAWGQDFIISCSPVVGGIVVRSIGPDKLFGTHDDIVSDR